MLGGAGGVEIPLGRSGRCVGGGPSRCADGGPALSVDGGGPGRRVDGGGPALSVDGGALSVEGGFPPRSCGRWVEGGGPQACHLSWWPIGWPMARVGVGVSTDLDFLGDPEGPSQTPRRF